MPRQELIWMPKSETARGHVPFSGGSNLPERPNRVWTLSYQTDESKPPTLPFTPVHNQTAFLEDFMHDWIIRSGNLYYFSRVVDLRQGGIWILLEWN